MVTRPVITSMAETIRLNWRRVVAVTWGWRHWQSATIATIGALRCGVWVVILHNATLHDNGPPYLIFGEGIDMYEGFVNAAKEVFGKRVKIVIDRFHVAKLYRRGVDRLR